MTDPSKLRRGRTVRVFISSTFLDMRAERDHLVTVVFPELRERLERLGLELFDVDLRWGVPGTGVDGERTNSWAYCKQWVERVEPFFVCMLGQRYGWIPPASDLRHPDDRQYGGLSITEMEVRHAVFDPARRRRSFFYLRESTVPRPGTAERLYLQFVDDEHGAALDALKAAIRATRRPVRDYSCRWTGTGFIDLEAFGQMVLEDLWSGVLRDERYVSKDLWHAVLGHDPEGDPTYTDERTPIPATLSERIIELAGPAHPDPLHAEEADMATFGASRIRWFQGRIDELNQLRTFVFSSSRPNVSALCVVRGAAGTGKSALLAKLSQELATSECVIITHFVGATERSADVWSLMNRLVAELDRQGIKNGEEGAPRVDFEGMRARLALRLGTYDREPRLVLIVDGLNQLSDGHDLAWLPQRLGSNVRVVLSCLDDGSAQTFASRVIDALSRRQPVPTWLTVGDLEESDARSIVQAFLIEYCKELTEAETTAIVTLRQAKNPLYLLVMLHELRTLGGDGIHLHVGQLIEELAVRCPDTVSLFDWMLERLEVFGEATNRYWWTYLSLSRIGMSGRELSDLLERAFDSAAARAGRRIERSVRRYLQHRGAQWDFFHGDLREAAVRRYGTEAAATFHRNIATYFDTEWRHEDTHALLELPYHQAAAGDGDALARTLSTFDFLDCKVRRVGVAAVLADFAIALSSGLPLGDSWPGLAPIREAVTLSQHVVSQDPAQLRSQLAGRLLDVSASPVPHLLVQLSTTSEPWLRPLTAALASPGTQLVRTLESHREISARIASLGRRAAVARRDGTISVYDIDTGAALHSWTGYADGAGFTATADGRYLVAGQNDGLISIFDADTGHIVSELRTIPARVPVTRIIRGHEVPGETGNTMYRIAVTPDGSRLVAAGEDWRLRIWSLESRELIAEIDINARVTQIVTDGRRVVAASNAWVNVWDLETTGLMKTIHFAPGTGPKVGIAPNCSLAISTCSQYHVFGVPLDRPADAATVWDLESGASVSVFTLQDVCTGPIAVSPNGRYSVLSMGTTDIVVIRTDTGEVEWNRDSAHASWIQDVAVTSDGQNVITTSREGDAKVWRLRRAERDVADVFGGAAALIRISSDGQRAVSISRGETIRTWNARTGASMRTVFTGSIASNSLVAAITADGYVSLLASGSIYANVWDNATGERVRVLKGHSANITSVVVTPDGTRAITGSVDNSLRVWTLADGECCTLMQIYSGFGLLSPDGKTFVSPQGSHVDVWDVYTNGYRLRLPDTAHYQRSLGEPFAFTPDGKQLLCVGGAGGGFRGELDAWNLRNGTLTSSAKIPLRHFKSLIVAPHGRLVVLVDNDGQIATWHLDNLRLERAWTVQLEQCDHNFLTPVMTADGEHLVSASRDRQAIVVWRARDGKRVAMFHTEERAWSFACGPDGKLIVVGDIVGGMYFLILENTVTTAPWVTPWGMGGGDGTIECPTCGVPSAIPLTTFGSLHLCSCCGATMNVSAFSLERVRPQPQ